MGKKQACKLLALVLAERVFREEESKQVHIAGTFNQINAQNFPATFGRMHVYVALTGLSRAGEHEFKVVIRYADGAAPEDIVAASGKWSSKGEPHELTELNAALINVSFPRPGLADVFFYLDGELQGERPLKIAQAKPG